MSAAEIFYLVYGVSLVLTFLLLKSEKAILAIDDPNYSEQKQNAAMLMCIVPGLNTGVFLFMGCIITYTFLHGLIGKMMVLYCEIIVKLHGQIIARLTKQFGIEWHIKNLEDQLKIYREIQQKVNDGTAK